MVSPSGKNRREDLSKLEQGTKETSSKDKKSQNLRIKSLKTNKEIKSEKSDFKAKKIESKSVRENLEKNVKDSQKEFKIQSSFFSEDTDSFSLSSFESWSRSASGASTSFGSGSGIGSGSEVDNKLPKARLMEDGKTLSITISGQDIYVLKGHSSNDQIENLNRRIIDNPKTEVEKLWNDLAIEGFKRQKICETSAKKRFPNVVCPRQTAVKVGDTFLHANKVRMPSAVYIAAQAPLKETEELFWKAAVGENATILDLSTEEDKLNKGVQQYYPNKGETKDYQTIKVTCKNVENKKLEGLSISTYEIVLKKESKAQTVKRIHYNNWRDYSVQTTKVIDQLIDDVEKTTKKDLLIHCRAGVGRTGTFMVEKEIHDLVKKRKITKDNYKTIITKLILKGREDRNDLFVQTLEQFKSILIFAEQRLDLSGKSK